MTKRTARNLFISYARDDEDFVTRLRDGILSHVQNINILDGRNIAPGENILNAISTMIASSNIVLVVYSEKSASSSWVSSELAIALADRQRSNKKIIPILIGLPETVSPLLIDTVYIDFRNPAEFKKKIHILVSTISDLRQISPSIDWERDQRISIAAKRKQLQTIINLYEIKAATLHASFIHIYGYSVAIIALIAGISIVSEIAISGSIHFFAIAQIFAIAVPFATYFIGRISSVKRDINRFIDISRVQDARLRGGR